MNTPQVGAVPHADQLSVVAWHISTKSDNGGGNCVEAGRLADGTGRVAVRHSRFPDGPAILYSKAEWEAFTEGIRGGEFDLAV